MTHFLRIDRKKCLWCLAVLAAFGFAATARGEERQKVMPLEAMAEKAVFFDDRLEFAVQVQHMERLIDWLIDNRFNLLRSEALREWMLRKIDEGAYGSVVVMPMGLGPQSINLEPGKAAAWYRYLKAGGRVVWIGNPPFCVWKSVTGEPPAHAVESLETLGLGFGWGQPFWGSNREVTLTEQGKAWGLEVGGASITGFNADEVSLVFSEYTTAQTGQRGAASWLLNLRPDMPSSGLAFYAHSMDARNDTCLRDTWRLAHYVGRPVTEIPPLPGPWQPPDPPAIEVLSVASGLEGRTQFARGEQVEITCRPARAGTFDSVRVHLIKDDLVLETLTGTTKVTLDTGPYAFGDYGLRVEAIKESQPVAFRDLEIGIRYVRPVEFGWEVWTDIPDNPYQAKLVLDDIRDCDMDVYIGHSVRSMDWLLRYDRRFSERVHADPGQGVTPDSHPQRFIVGPDGSFRRWGGGNIMFGISHPECLEAGRKQMIEGITPAAKHPAFNGIVLTNDDYSSLHYGVDYSQHNLDRFKAMTGHDAPGARPQRAPGVVPDDDPWLQWCLFTLRHVSGGWNRMQKEAVTSVRDDIRIGPIPGGMQIPVIHMWPAGQYPPLNFGQQGHNLIACYYYNSYWQPITTNTCWIECGRMGNRDLPAWLMPDLMRPLTTYTRNNLFHLLAAGVNGLSYFTYTSRTREAWDEMRRVTPMIWRIAPVQGRIRPGGRRVALLHSVTSDIFRETNWLSLPYAYANLIQAHYDVDVICEEEVLAGICKNYDAVLLSRTPYLRQSVYDALAGQAKEGAAIYLDSTVPLDVPGARRLDIDLGLGRPADQDSAANRVRAATPGPQDYGHPDRIRAVGQALRPFVEPQFESDDERIVAHPFEYDGVKYVWYVNALSGEEYGLCQNRLMGLRTAAAMQEVIDWEKKELREHPVWETTVRYRKLPGVPYDLWKTKPLEISPEDEDASLTLSMDRLGGTLVAFYPSPIRQVTMQCPKQVTPMQPVTVEITVTDASGPIPGTVPVEIVLRDPQGEPSPLSRVVGTEKGQCTFEWRPAVNDPLGTWTITARQCASGTETKAAIVLGDSSRRCAKQRQVPKRCPTSMDPCPS